MLKVSWNVLTAVLKVDDGMGVERLREYRLLTPGEQWLPLPSRGEGMVLHAASPGKTNTQNSKYSFY